MNYVYKIAPNPRLPYLYIKIIIILLALFDPVLPQIILGDFSTAYLELIRDTRTHHEWWKTCQNADYYKPDNICRLYITSAVESNSTQPRKPVAEQIEDFPPQDEEKEEFTFFEVIEIVAEQLYKVALESWGELIDYLVLSTEEDSRPVQYDDNFASLNGGAIILRKSSNKIHNAQSILEDSTEKYLYSDEKLPFEIIIALKEEAKIERISIKSIEIYSSVVKSFILEGALNQDEDEPGESNIWFKLLSAEAKNTGAEQQFRTKNKAVRFLRLRILSKHGDWKYFTMTQLKVYGSGLFTEALIDYQTVQNNTSQAQINQTQIELANDLSLIYKQLNDNFRQEVQKKPDQNVLTFLLEKVSTLSKIHEFQIFYMNNMSQRLENFTKIETEFREHKNQYEAKSNFEEKYRQHRKVEQKITDLEENLKIAVKKSNDFIQQFKYTHQTDSQECPNQDQELRVTIITAVIASIIANMFITAFIAYCCFRFNRRENRVQEQQERDQI